MKRPAWLTQGARIAVGASAIACVALSPALREAAIRLQPSLTGLLVTVGLAFGLTSLAIRWQGSRARRRRWLRREHALGRVLARWGWVGAVVLALLPILSHWAMRPPDSVSAFSSFLGHIPWKDSRLHLEGALHLLDQGTFGLYSERRPLTAAWLAARIAVAGNVEAALLIQAVFFGLALYALGRVVGVRLGPWAALIVCGVTLGLTAGFLPTYSTEPLGATLAACGLALLFSRAARARASVLAAGVFTLTLALGARPGPQLLVPAFVAWGIARANRGTRVRTALILCASAAFAVGATSTVNALYGKGESGSTAHVAYMLYGLSSGSNYQQFVRDFGAATVREQGDREVARWLYAKILTNLRERPGDFVHALASNLRRFLSKLPSNLASPLSVAPLFSQHPIEAPTPSGPNAAGRLAEIVPFLLALGAGSLYVARRSARGQGLFWLAFALGMLGSVPFVYGDAGFRGLAVSYPFFGLALGLGLATRQPSLGPTGRRGERAALRLAWILPLVILVSGLAVPAAAKRHWPRPAAATLSNCTPHVDFVIDMQLAPAVVVSRSPRKGLAERPWLTPAEYQGLLAYGAFSDDAGIENLAPPFAVASVYDFVTQQQYVLIAPLEALRQPSRFVALKVEPLGTGGKIYRALSTASADGPSSR
jgi:hypothetical protein